MEFTDTPLEEVVAFLRNEYNIEVQLDTPSLDDFGIGPDKSVDIQARNTTLGAALQLLLNQLELGYTITDGVLMITTQEEVELRLTTAVYCLDGMDIRPNAMHRALTQTVAPSSWQDKGGSDAEAILVNDRTIVISQTTRAHEQIHALLGALRSAMKDATSPAKEHAGRGRAAQARALEETAHDQDGYNRAIGNSDADASDPFGGF
ncbi:hypothetical protein [Pseudobythopirellula maris]|nr:hypothetical protein [Pseudobythopirellula maris]